LKESSFGKMENRNAKLKELILGLAGAEPKQERIDIYMDIKQVVYSYETVPTELRATVDGVLITYKRTKKE